jgi:hypothetical protein
VPTHEESPEFWACYGQLTADQQQRFRVALKKMVVDLRQGNGIAGIRGGLRVKGIRGRPGLYEMTWAPDGRAVFAVGDEVRPGETHILWLAVGTHAVL